MSKSKLKNENTSYYKTYYTMESSFEVFSVCSSRKRGSASAFSIFAMPFLTHIYSSYTI